MDTAEQESGITRTHQPRTLGQTVELIQAGRTDLIADLRRALRSSPELQEMEDIGQRTQRAWAGLLAGGDVLRREVFLLQADQLRTELAGEGATAAERIMAERVVGLQQQTAYFEQLQVAGGIDMLDTQMGRAIADRQEKANRQLNNAVRQLGVVQKLQAEIQPGNRPAVALRIFSPDKLRRSA